MHFDVKTDLYQHINSLKQTEVNTCKQLKNKIDIRHGLKRQDKIIVINYIVLTCVISKHKSIEYLKRDKIFSLGIYSKNDFVIKIIKFMIINCDILELNENDKIYLNSKLNLTTLSSDIFKKTQNIRKIFSNDPSYARNILFFLDYHTFMIGRNENEINLSIDALSEACSYLLFEFAQVNKKHIVSEKTIAKIKDIMPRLLSLINDALLIINFQSMQKAVDSLDFKCTKNKNKLTIENSNPKIEQARAYGNAYTENQYLAFGHNIINEYKNAISLNKTLQNIIDKHDNNYLRRTKEPIERYILMLPSDDTAKKMLLNKEYYLEELIEIKFSQNEYNVENIENFKISKNTSITAIELKILKRLFVLISNLNSYSLMQMYKDKTIDFQVFYNSWSRVMKYDDLYNILLICFNEKQAKELIDLFSWTLNSNEKLDIQFTPFVKLNNDYYVAINTLVHSNLFRNSLYRNNIRPHQERDYDLISSVLASTLSEKFLDVKQEILYDYNGFVGDFDVIAYIDNKLYIFECKNIITPADFHEFRQTYENFKKGFSQLTKHCVALSNGKFIQYLKPILNWELSEDFEIVTCLVFDNRMLNGYSDQMHCVCSIRELLNFLESGKIRISKDEFSLWESDKITSNDLYGFLKNNSLHAIAYNCTNQKSNLYNYGEFNLEIKTFDFNMQSFIEDYTNMEKAQKQPY